MKLELRAEASQLRKKGMTLRQIAFHLGVNERTVYKWSSADGWEKPAEPARGSGQPPPPPPRQDAPRAIDRVAMEPAALAASLWASLSDAARTLETMQAGTMLHTRTMTALAKVMAELRKIGEAAERSGDAAGNIEALKADLARRIMGLTQTGGDMAPERKGGSDVPALLRWMATAAVVHVGLPSR